MKAFYLSACLMLIGFTGFCQDEKITLDFDVKPIKTDTGKEKSLNTPVAEKKLEIHFDTTKYVSMPVRRLVTDKEPYTINSKTDDPGSENKPVRKVKFSPDGKYLMVATEGFIVKSYNAETKTEYSKITGHFSKVNALNFFQKDSIVVSGGNDEMILLHKYPNGDFIKFIGPEKPRFNIGAVNASVYDLHVTPDGKSIILIGNAFPVHKNKLQLWDIASGKMTGEFKGHTSMVPQGVLTKDGKFLYTCSADGSVKMWDVASQALVKNIIEGQGEILTIALSADEKYLAFGGGDRKVWLYNLETGEKVFEFWGHLGMVESLCFHPGGQYLVSGGADKLSIIWDLKTGAEYNRLLDAPDRISSIDITPNGDKMAIGFENGTFKIQEFNELIKQLYVPVIANARKTSIVETPFANLKKPPLLVFEKGAHTADVSVVKFTPDGKEIITASWDKTIRVWEASGGKLLRTIHVPAGEGIEGQIFAMDISPDGKFLIAAGSALGHQNTKTSGDYIGDYILLIDYATGEILQSNVEAKHDQSLHCVAFSSDGLFAASGGGSYDNKIALYKVNKIARKLEFIAFRKLDEVGKDYSPNCANSPTNFVGICSQMVFRTLFIPGTNDLITADEYGTLFRFSNNLNNHLLIGESSGRKVATITGKLRGKEYFHSLAVDPKGKFVAAGDMTGITEIFDTKGNGSVPVKGKSFEKKILSIPSFENKPVYALAFSPQGNRIAVVNGKKIKIFELTNNTQGITATPISTFYYHLSDVMAVAFSNDGNTIVSTGVDPQEIYAWDAANGNLKFKLGKVVKNSIISTVGVNKNNPLMIGFGTDMNSNPSINNNGRISVAFDFGKFELVENVNTVDYITAQAAINKYNTPVPELRFLTMTEPVHSYIPLNKDNILIGGKYNLYLNYMTIPIFNAGSKVTGLAMSQDETTFYVSYEAGYIQVYDAKSTKLVASLYVSAEKDWVVWTPDGYYAASKIGAQALAWLLSKGAKESPGYYPFEQFDLRLNRPDIILTRIGGADKNLVDELKKAYLKRLKKHGLREENISADMESPVVSISLKNGDSNQKNVTFSVTAQSKNTSLQSLAIYVNDVPIYGVAGKSFATPKGQKKQEQVSLELNNGQNKIQVSVLNAAGVESLKETRYVNYTGVAEKPELFIVTIGVSEYMNSEYNLTYAAKDAEDIAGLYNQKAADYKNIQVLKLNNANAVKDKIALTKQNLLKSKVDDMVIVFVAAHGLLDNNNNYFIATNDCDFNNPAERGLSYDNLQELLDGIPARKKLVMIDACHSGELDKDEALNYNNSTIQNNSNNGMVKMRGFKYTPKTDANKKEAAPSMNLSSSSELMKELFNDLRRGTGAMVISSAGGAEFAFESSEWNNGVFTYSVLEGLKTGNADKNKDKEVTVSELRDYVFARVKELTQGKQNPTSRQENLEFDFRVW